jgi:hypothetical protein
MRRSRMRPGHGLCWACGRQFQRATTGKTRGQLSFTEVVVDGSPVRVHHRCAKTYTARLAREQVTAREIASQPFNDAESF